MDPDTTVVWLLKQARVWEGPGWECVMCGALHADVKTWPCCPPVDRGFVYEDFEYRSERGHVFTVAADKVGPFLDLWDQIGFWDKKFSTWPPQLKAMLDAYETYLVDFTADEAEQVPQRAAQALIRDAMLACLVSNGGKPLTITELVRSEPKLCGEAVTQAGLGGSVRHGALKLLEADPEVVAAGPRKGFPTWTLSGPLLTQHGLDAPDLAGDEERRDQAKRDLIKLANQLVKESGRKSWTVRKFRMRFPDQTAEILDRLGGATESGRDLGVLLHQFKDAFCVVGYGQNVAHWSLQEDAVEANQRLHEDQFANFVHGGGDEKA